VDGLDHFQVRHSAEAVYEYQRTSLEFDSPVALLWDLLGRIEESVVENSNS